MKFGFPFNGNTIIICTYIYVCTIYLLVIIIALDVRIDMAEQGTEKKLLNSDCQANRFKDI